ncbi:nitroreductase family protein [Saccharopolyspora phatthalungensis]|uniref:Nitroreductase n=1 Tax=Saccharopolyspora phatthalungensis TaxID=664693 RepID=A0A840QDK6_9PSEU|nr:nitroreductase family protein [Saccharopolyspora phatthalungensis]MBB5158087.1 nitroreductase [Saccharopolyspora phatthalungensis]
MTRVAPPSYDTVCSALSLACRAPSVHNCQPWRWLLAERSLQLFLDRSRLPEVLDPAGRAQVISCGAVLHHARIAFGALGWRTMVHRLPNAAQPDHLASIQFSQHDRLAPAMVALAGAAGQRHAARGPYRAEPVPPELLMGLRAAAETEHGALVRAAEHRGVLVESLQRAGWLRESAAYQKAVADLDDPEPASPVLTDEAVFAVLATRGDWVDSWLAAGEALSAVLLAAVRDGLATCPLNQLGEVAEIRERVQETVLGGAGYAQLVLRLGWPGPEEALPTTSRRPLAESLELLPPRNEYNSPQ